MEHRQILLGLLVLVIVFPFCTSSIIDTITPTQQLLADGTILVSKEKNFALGFFSPGNSSYLYVGIWYFKIPEKTVVWVANRDNPIKGSSGVLWIDTLGNLVLNQTNQNLTLWSTNVSGSATTGNRVAKLLDTGNLVLVEEKTGKEVWQSFDYPSNTMLPGMKLGVDLKSGLNRFLTSWKSPADPGTGEYSVKLDPRGAPQLFLYKGLTPIWRSRSWPWNGVVDTALVYSLNYSFVKDDDDEIYLVYVVDDDSIISRLVLDDSGNFERFTWLIDVGRWKGYMSAPKSYCEFYGQCGANSICHPNEVYSFECSCLPGFQATSPEDWYLRDRTSGCMRKHGAYTCGDGGVGFLEVGKVKVPDTSAARVEMGLNLRACEEACLLNCSCTAYSSISIPGDRTVCLTWYGGLIDMAEYSNGGFDFYVRADAIDLAENRRKSKVFFQKKGILVIHITSAAVALFLMVIFVYLWLKKRKARDSLLTKVKPEKCRTPTDLPFLDLSTILSATNNFSLCNKLGEGGFGSVYKGKLADGQDIAVKRLSKNSGQGIQEFKNEVALIAKLQHRNLAKLLGSCIEGEETILIYEYLPNKSLDSFIFDQTRRAILNWRKRFEIIVGIARGVLYLHQDSRLRIIHRDLKTSNILLDDDMNPKISDFGMARIFGGDNIQDNTKRVVGTFGYMSPEYATLGQFSTKSDVFSFGVILLEIVSGKRNSSYYQGGSSLTLIGRIWALWKQERALEMADSSLRESFIPHEVLRCIHVGLLCVQENVTDRPTMLEVVLILVSETTLPLPKEPAFIFGTCNPVDSSAKGETPCSVNDVTISNLEAR